MNLKLVLGVVVLASVVGCGPSVSPDPMLCTNHRKVWDLGHASDDPAARDEAQKLHAKLATDMERDMILDALRHSEPGWPDLKIVNSLCPECQKNIDRVNLARSSR